MDARSFLEKHGKDVATKVAEAAGTNYAYFSQLAYLHRRPSVDLASSLVKASEKEIPAAEDRLDFLSLIMKKKGVTT